MDFFFSKPLFPDSKHFLNFLSFLKIYYSKYFQVGFFKLLEPITIHGLRKFKIFRYRKMLKKKSSKWIKNAENVSEKERAASTL